MCHPPRRDRLHPAAARLNARHAAKKAPAARASSTSTTVEGVASVTTIAGLVPTPRAQRRRQKHVAEDNNVSNRGGPVAPATSAGPSGAAPARLPSPPRRP